MAKATLLLESTKPLLGGSSDVIKLELGGQSMPAAAAGIVDHLARLYGKDWAAAIDRLRELCGVESNIDAHHQALRARDEVIAEQDQMIRKQTGEMATVLAKCALREREAAELRAKVEELEAAAQAHRATNGGRPLYQCTGCSEIIIGIPGGDDTDGVTATTQVHSKRCSAIVEGDSTSITLRRLWVECVA